MPGSYASRMEDSSVPWLQRTGLLDSTSSCNSKDEICLVLSDIIMPGINGIDMAESILQVDPQAKILLMSGYSDEVVERQGRQRFPFIRKPFIHIVLIEKIRYALGISDGAASP